MPICDCPFCPLVAINAQVCNVIITLAKNGYKIEADKHDGMTEEIYDIKINFVKLALAARDYGKIKKGEFYSDDTDDYRYDVECLRKNKFKVCFHAKKKEEVLEDPI